MRKPLVSVIIPNYNKEKFLSNCIKSVLSQSYKNFEIIIIDNFSDDKSLEVIKNFDDKRIRLIQFKNNGIIAASRNIGIEKSRGKYLAFLDSDDYWTKEKLFESIKHLEKGADFLYHDFFLYNKKSIKTLKILKSKLLRKPIKYDLICNGNRIITSSVVVRKELFNLNKNFSENRNLITVEDFDAWIRFSMISEKFVYLPKILGYLFVGKSNTSNSSFLKLKGARELLSIYSKEIKNVSKCPNHFYCDIAFSYFKLGCYKLAIKNLFKIDFLNITLFTLIKTMIVLILSMFLIPLTNRKNSKTLV